MSATIFGHKAQLVEPLLQTADEADSSSGRESAGPGVNTAAGDYSTQQPVDLQESHSSSLDSSRRTLNQAQSGGQSRELDLEAGVELSPPPESGGSRSMSYYAYEDRQDSLEKEGEEEDDTDSRDELVLGEKFASQLITNHSAGAYRTLPKPYNPG